MSSEGNKNEVEAKVQEGKAKANEAKQSIIQRLKDDGVVNPQGLAFVGFGFVFLAAVPVTSFIAQPNGLLEKAINGVCSTVAFLGSAGANTKVSATGKIAALSTLYIAMTYAFTGAASAAGTACSTEEGRDNKQPRAQTKDLKGLPLRMHSAHYNLMEMFPGFALSAALTQSMAPSDQTLINLLGLHVLAKVFLYYPSYLFNIDAARSAAHVIATASVINVALRLSKKPFF